MRKLTKDSKICVLYGGENSEREVSLNSGKSVYDTLINGGYKNTYLLDFTRATAKELVDNTPDVCMNALHGGVGENGVLQGYLEILRIPYSGCGVKASAIGFDKHYSKLCFIDASVPTPEYTLYDSSVNLASHLPCVIKPANEGSSVGVTIAHTLAEAKEGANKAISLDKKILIEQLIEGKEFTVSLLGRGDGSVDVLPPLYLKPSSEFFDYNAKYTEGMTHITAETGLAEEETQLLKDTALRAYRAIGCEGMTRVDIIYDGVVPYVLELNTSPGMTSTSLFPKACKTAGISFLELLETVLNDALNRWR